jgi:hypothetical protein
VKWLFFSLVLVNLALYLWATGHPQGREAASPAPAAVVNSRGMMLLAERDEDARAGGGSCVRIGPFQTQSTFADASRILGDMGLEYGKSAVSARKLQTWRAYVPAPAAQAELASLRSRLSELEVDHHVEEDAGGSIVSVGVFSQSSDARRFAAELKQKGVEVTYRPELRTLGPMRWIIIEERPDRHAMEQLQAANWGDAMARVVDFPCAR